MINELKKLFYQMLRIRLVEEEISKRYIKQKIRCPVHLSIGQEAIAVGVCNNLKKNDKIFSSHRSHAHYIAKGGNLKRMILEIHGKKGGCSNGKGGSMHLFDLEVNMIASVPILGSTIPIAVGTAWADKLKKNKNLTVVFFGDGATEEGVFFESLDYAALYKVPILFVCENNMYSVFSNISSRQSKKRNLAKIAKSLGIKSYSLDGTDVNMINKFSKQIISDIKKGKGPCLLEFKTYRFYEHCGPNKDDDLNYRKKSEISSWNKKCPLKKLNNILKKDKKFNKDYNIHKYKIEKEIKTIFDLAESAPFPNIKTLLSKTYA